MKRRSSPSSTCRYTCPPFYAVVVQIKELVFILQKAKLIILVKTSKAARRLVVIYNLMRGDGCGFFVRSYEWERGLKIVCGWIWVRGIVPFLFSLKTAETIKYEIKFTDRHRGSIVGKPIRITRDYEHEPKGRPLTHWKREIAYPLYNIVLVLFFLSRASRCALTILTARDAQLSLAPQLTHTFSASVLWPFVFRVNYHFRIFSLLIVVAVVVLDANRSQISQTNRHTIIAHCMGSGFFSLNRRDRGREQGEKSYGICEYYHQEF